MRRGIGIGALVALVILNIFLIPRALDRGKPDPGAATTRVVSPTTPSGTASNQASPGATDGTALDGPTLMAADGDVVVQAQRGGCETEAAPGVVISTDGGKSFERADPGSDIRGVLAIGVADDQITLTAADSDCQVVTATRGVSQGGWSTADAAAGWSLLGDPTRKAVRSPDGREETPCVPTALSTETDQVVRLVCDDGRLLGRDGEGWASLGHLDGASAIRYPTPARGFAIAPGDTCPIAVFTTRDGGTEWTELSCLDGADGPGAIAGRDGHYVARAGGVTLVSTDTGKTWQTP